jgi:hypothetical protein
MGMNLYMKVQICIRCAEMAGRLSTDAEGISSQRPTGLNSCTVSKCFLIGKLFFEIYTFLAYM